MGMFGSLLGTNSNHERIQRHRSKLSYHEQLRSKEEQEEILKKKEYVRIK